MVTNKTTPLVKARQTDDPHLVIFKTSAGVFMRRIRWLLKNLSRIFPLRLKRVKPPGTRDSRLIATQRSLLDGRADWVMGRRWQEFFGA